MCGVSRTCRLCWPRKIGTVNPWQRWSAKKGSQPQRRLRPRRRRLPRNRLRARKRQWQRSRKAVVGGWQPRSIGRTERGSEDQRRVFKFQGATMGQKVHPYGFRLGYTKPWKSRWFVERDYDKLLL